MAFVKRDSEIFSSNCKIYWLLVSDWFYQNLNITGCRKM